MKKNIIDTNKDPLIPYENWTVEEHIKNGKIEWNPKKVSLYISEKQKSGYINGHALRKEIKNPLNANVLDYLLNNLHLIPEEWKADEKGQTRYIYFWDTIYRDSGDNLFVRCLYWVEGRWLASYGWLDGQWDGRCPALLLASSNSQSSSPSDLDTLSSRVQNIEQFMKDNFKGFTI